MDLPCQPILRSLEPLPTLSGKTLILHFNFSLQIGALFGYILHHTRGQKLKLDLVVNLLFWQVTYLDLGSCHPYFPQASFLAAFAVVYGLYDLRTGGQTTLFMATAYNAFQVLLVSSL